MGCGTEGYRLWSEWTVDATESGVRQDGPVTTVTGSRIAASRAAATRLFALRPRPVWQGLLAFAIYLAVFIGFFALPLVRNLNVPVVGQNEVDPNFYIWAWRWWPYAVTHLTNPLYSHQIGAPAGFDLAWVTTAPPLALAMWPVTALWGPIAAFNLSLVLLPPVSGLTAFIAARRLTGRFWAALVAGALYGFCCFELTHEASGQPNLTVITLFPLMVYVVLLWRDGALRRIGYVSWMTVLMALEFYLFLEAFFEMTVMWAAILVIGLALAGRAYRSEVFRLAVLTAIAYVGALVLASPYLIYALKHNPHTLTRQLPLYSMDLMGLIVPRLDRTFGITSLSVYSHHYLHSSSTGAYIGIPLLLLLIAMAVFARKNKVTWLLVSVFVVAVLLCLGPNLIVGGRQRFALPWGGLWAAPIAESAEPSRFIVFGYLALVFVLALWLTAPVRGRLRHAGRWALALLGLAFILADLPTFYQVVVPQVPHRAKAVGMRPENQMPAFITDGLYRHYLKQGEIVAVVSDRGNAGMLFQADTDFYFRIAGGFINASLTKANALPPQFSLLTYPNHDRVAKFRAYIKTSGINDIVVEHAWAESWTKIFGQMHYPATSVGGVTVYSITPYKPS
jgi:hypothetical protein